MSRVDQAWRRASSGGTHQWEIPPRAEHLEQSDRGVLHHYPRESGPSGISAPIPDRSPDRTVVALRPGERRQLGTLHAAFEGKLVVIGRATPIAVEQYRRLTGAIHELQVEQGLKTLMVTSALPNEGKTLTVVNLALTLSESCRRQVLLIDADLRRPFLHEVFQLPNARGLSDVLRSERGELPLVQVSEHLSVLPAGHSDQPMAGLTSDRMRVLLEQSAATFDWVLLDAAPVGLMPDAQLLARLTRAVLFVIAAHSTPQLLVSRAIAQLDPECVVGTLLNYVEEHNIPAAGYYHQYYSPARQAD
jgi:capsular exopolysaccharide synthesis family protein